MAYTVSSRSYGQLWIFKVRAYSRPCREATIPIIAPAMDAAIVLEVDDDLEDE